MLQATKNKYDIETLKTLNVLYDREHRLTQEDVDMANRYVELIERTRLEITPQVGDRLIYLSRYGDYYGNALIDSMDEKKNLLSICEQPYVPFVWQSADNIRLSVSGGAFHHVKTDDLKFNGWTEGAFKDWGHCRSCANGAVTFTARVPQWRQASIADPKTGTARQAQSVPSVKTTACWSSASPSNVPMRIH